MTSREPNESPGPDPEETPGLDSGGSVPPGETPPEASSATDAVSHPQRATARSATWIWLAVIFAVVVLVALFFAFLGLELLPW